ncbi:MAG: SOS response-associated peptidase [Clostridia bacterium]|nr:SOS response-associated peptidase [Clostridia bacterium]
MCGRYTTEIETDERELFRMLVRAEENAHPTSVPHMSAGGSIAAVRGREVYPSEQAAVLVGDASGEVDAWLYRWGFDAEIGGRRRLLINARAESAAAKPMFAPHLTERRCVIPTAGFFEWAHTGGRADPRLKYRFNLPDSGILYLAGLYRPSQSAPGCWEFVILTRAANDSMLPIHDRMPVILRTEHVQEYLCSAGSAGMLLEETPPVLVKKLVS